MVDLDIFITSRVKRKIVVFFVTYPAIKMHIRGLAELLKEDPGNIQRELNKLEKAGFLFREKRKNTFVYFDPPYRPLNQTSSFTSYTEYTFGDKEQVELSEYFKLLNEKGAKLLLSNSDPKNVDINDEFFDDLYEGFDIKRIEASRAINSKGEKRGKVTEVLVSNI